MDGASLNDADKIRGISGMFDIFILTIGFCIGIQTLQHNGDVFG